MRRVRPKAVDLRALKLSAEEGFVLSRIESELSVRDLVGLCGIEEPRVEQIVERLAAEGAVEFPGEPPMVRSVAPPVLVDGAFRAPAPSFAGIDELDDISLDAEPGTGLVVTVCGVTDVGVVRTNNEDALAVMDLTSGEIVDVSSLRDGLEVGPRGVLLAVSDGMGGENAGEVASALTLESMEKYLAVGVPGDDVAVSLAEAVEEANARVTEAAKVPGRDGMGATLVALLIQGNSAHSAEVGDSRAYVLRRGRLTQITKDQTQIQILLDQGLLTPEAAKSSHAKNIVLQAIGKTPDVVVAQRRFALRHGDRLLLCSDGLTAHVANAEIAQILGAAPSVADACAQLVTTANQRGGKDNITVIAADVASPAASQDDYTDVEPVDETLTTTRAFSVGEDTP